LGKKADYGLGHQAFLNYVQFIIKDPAYAGMPDLYKDDATIQWEAPSNRGGGKYEFTNRDRRAWWANKARSIGLDPNRDSAWLSRTAKAIHPTKRKPCKKCGLELDLRYVYPSAILIRRLLKLSFLNGVDQIDPLEDIFSLVQWFDVKYGDEFMAETPNLLKAKGIVMPSGAMDVAGWLKWIEGVYVPSEPPTLSPGAMSNAPDRLDGFHSFNICHRRSADTGRHRENMASYVTDRRVFELWVDGDWIAADRLMGRIRSHPDLQTAGCFYGAVHKSAPPTENSTADHIGPISLGFCHRDEFQLLCKSCNSTKNNRIRVEDVQRLIAVENMDNPVISWYAERIWNLRKGSVVDADTALRLAKTLRDNRYTYMMILSRLLDVGFITFLCSLLHLEFAEYDVTDFTNLRAVEHLTVHDALVKASRSTTYVTEQKARRIRVAFSSLRTYASKLARNAQYITNASIESAIQSSIDTLNSEAAAVRAIDDKIQNILAARQIQEGELRSAVHRIEHGIQDAKAIFDESRKYLETAMALVGDELSGKWDDSRYNRNLELTDF
jgi:Alw26I/Eco31I/Esp3I family type II restriction endonuclease